MATNIKIKKSAVPGKVPLVADLEYGELAINYNDGILYFKNSSNQITGFNAGSLTDSASISSFIDSAYIQLRQSAAGGGTVDSADIIAIVDSAYVQARQASATAGATTIANYYYTAAAPQTTFTGADDFSNTLSYTEDKIQVYLNGALLKDSDDYTASNGSSIVLTTATDSNDVVTVTTFVTSIVGTLDSSAVTNLIDSAYIQLRQSASGGGTVDSADVITIVDSAYVQLRQTAQDFAYSSLTGAPNVLDSADVALIAQANDTTRDSAFVTNIIDSAYIQLRDTPQDFAYSSLTGAPTTVSSFTNDANYLDSTTVQGVIDASYIQSNQITYNTSNFADSAFVTAQIDALIDGAPGTLDTLNEIAAALNDDDSAYTTLVNLINAKSDLDSAAALNLIDAAYIQSNQITYNTSDFADSAFVTSQIAAISIPTLGNDFVDSEQVQLIVDSAYIQARQTAGGTDSATVISLITSTVDSAYVALREANAGVSGGGLDSAAAINLIDSAYVQLRQSTVSGGATTISNYKYTATSGQTTFTGSDDNSATLAYTVDKLNVYLNGILLLDSDDYTATNGTSVVLTTGANTNDVISIITYDTQAVGTLDSAGVLNLIDAAYIQSNQITYNTSDFVDSAFVTSQIPTLGNDFVDSGQVTAIIDSAYIQLRQSATGGGTVDSADIIAIVDSAYVQARQSAATAGATTITAYDYIATSGQTTFTGADIDGATLSYTPGKQQVFVNGILLVDSNDYTATSGNSIVLGIAADSNDVVSVIAYVTQAVGTLDSSGVTNLIDSAYIQARQSASSSSFDSAAALALIDASYIQSNQITYNTSDFADSAFVTSQIAAISIPSLGNDFVDSGQVTNIVDSAYIELRRSPEAIFNVANNGASAYTYTGDGFSSGRDNPTLYLYRGMTYKFSVNASGHPFQIRVSSGGSAYNTGVTNNGAQVGDVYFTPDMNAPNTLVYQCTVHSGMVGDIVILDNNSFLDSASVQGVIDATYIQSNQTTYDFLDSSEVIALIDSAYIQARQTSGGGTTQQAFKTISVAGQSDVVADDSADTLTLVAGSNITLTTNAGTDTVTIASTGGGGGGTDSASVIALIDSAYVQARQSTIGSTTVQNYFYTATSGQTDFTGADDQSNTLAYVEDKIQVYLNGILLKDSDDYTATDGTTVTLLSAAGLNDVIGITTYTEANQYAGGITTYDYVATAAQTVFSGADVNSNTLTYTSGSNLNVYLNGILLRDSDDYTATTGTSVTLVTGASVDDALSVVVYGSNPLGTLDSAGVIALIDSAYISARTGSLPWTEKTANYTAVAGDKLFVDPAASAITITLPASPSLGDEIRIIDASGNSATNNITVARNGNKINGADSDLTIDVDRSAIGLAYYNTANGWVLIER